MEIAFKISDGDFWLKPFWVLSLPPHKWDGNESLTALTLLSPKIIAVWL
jgi:hypothetical protein